MGLQSITRKRSLVGLLGWPVERSPRPAMENAGFATLGMDWAYAPLPVRPGEVEAALQGSLALGFVGCNVTVPHKETEVPFMNELSDSARAIGAVSAIHIRDGSLHGLNTDPSGFLNSLHEACWRPRGRRVALIGTGSAALVDQMAGLFRSDALSYRPLTKGSFVVLGKGR